MTPTTTPTMTKPMATCATTHRQTCGSCRATPAVWHRRLARCAAAAASHGAELGAYARLVSLDGVTRYRVAGGWLSNLWRDGCRAAPNRPRLGATARAFAGASFILPAERVRADAVLHRPARWRDDLMQWVHECGIQWVHAARTSPVASWMRLTCPVAFVLHHAGRLISISYIIRLCNNIIIFCKL